VRWLINFTMLRTYVSIVVKVYIHLMTTTTPNSLNLSTMILTENNIVLYIVRSVGTLFTMTEIWATLLGNSGGILGNFRAKHRKHNAENTGFQGFLNQTCCFGSRMSGVQISPPRPLLRLPLKILGNSFGRFYQKTCLLSAFLRFGINGNNINR